jgi:heat shock protein HslJ
MTHRRIPALLLIVTLLLAACSSGPGTGGQLEGTEWILRSYAQEGELVLVPETQYADAKFSGHRVAGLSGCNQYDALFRAGGRSLLVSEPAVTLMACDEASMAFETAYLAALEASRFFSVRRDTLTIFAAGGKTSLVFDASPRNPLLGTWRVDSFEVEPGTVTAPLDDTELEVVFGLASVGGFAGCNSFSGTYGTNGNAVRISRLATTMMACDDAIMAQETAFLHALQGVAFLDRQASTMLLTDRGGSQTVALVRPVIEEEPTPQPTESAEPTETPEATESAEPTEAPTGEPTPAPTATPAPTEAPTAPPPIILPTVATCDLLGTDGATQAEIVYPGAWSTVAEPPELACRYFDPGPIAVPDDPATLTTAISVATTDAAYSDAVADATDPAIWDVRQQVDLTVDGLPATLVEATALVDTVGVAVGTSRLVFLVDYGAAGTMGLFTSGATDDEAYAAHATILTLMVALSTFNAPG